MSTRVTDTPHDKSTNTRKHTVILTLQLPLFLGKNTYLRESKSSYSFSWRHYCVQEIITLAIRAQWALTFQPTLLSNFWGLKHFQGKTLTILVNLGIKTTIFSLVLSPLSASVIQIFRSELQMLLKGCFPHGRIFRAQRNFSSFVSFQAELIERKQRKIALHAENSA